MGGTSPRHPGRIGSPALRGEGPGTLTQAPDTGTEHGFTSVGCVRGPWRSPRQRGAVERWQRQCSINRGLLSPERPAPEQREGRMLREGWQGGLCVPAPLPSTFHWPELSHVAPTDRGAWEQPGREHLGGKGNQLGGVQPAFICHWEEPSVASFALRKPKLRVGPAARLGGDRAGTQLWPCP